MPSLVPPRGELGPHWTVGSRRGLVWEPRGPPPTRTLACTGLVQPWAFTKVPPTAPTPAPAATPHALARACCVRPRCAPWPGRLGPPRVPRRRRPVWRAYDPAGEPCCSPGASPFPPCARVSAASSLARWPRSSSLPPPDGHQPHQGPARAVDLGRGALHVTPLLAGLEVLAPAAVLHLPQQQEGAGPGDFRTGGPADRHQTRTPSGGRGRLRAAGLPPRLPATGAKGHR